MPCGRCGREVYTEHAMLHCVGCKKIVNFCDCKDTFGPREKTAPVKSATKE